jgi:metallo-beta-lactamase class B
MRKSWRIAAGLGVVVLLSLSVALVFPQLGVLAFSTIRRDNAPMEPFAIAPHFYYVGASDIAVFAIETSDGLILIDAGYAATAPMVLANVRTLNLDPKSVRILLNTHAHADHAGGLAALKVGMGAKLYASPHDADLLESGGRGDFFWGNWVRFPPVQVDHRLQDGEEVKLGSTTLTAHFTPGHTRGCTSWSFPLEFDGHRVQALEICSLSTLVYRLVRNKQYPDIAADFLRSFAVLRGLKCELFLLPHGKGFDLKEKRQRQRAGAAENPFIDPAGCRTYVDESETSFRSKLKAQGG